MNVLHPSLLPILHLSRPTVTTVLLRRSLFSTTTPKHAEGDTGSLRHGGMQSSDSWTRREKAAEDMYIKGREKAIMHLLKEKIAKQEQQLVKDLAMLREMEDAYGKAAES